MFRIFFSKCSLMKWTTIQLVRPWKLWWIILRRTQLSDYRYRLCPSKEIELTQRSFWKTVSLLLTIQLYYICSIWLTIPDRMKDSKEFNSIQVQSFSVHFSQFLQSSPLLLNKKYWKWTEIYYVDMRVLSLSLSRLSCSSQGL